MKFSFSTKGWHNSTFDDFCDIAVDLKFSGIELHNIHNRLFTDKDGAFHDYAANATVRKLFEKKLELPCIDTICNPADKSQKEETLKEIQACIDIASNLHIPNVRIRAIGQGETSEIADNMAEIIAKVLPLAEEKNIVILVETCGVFCDTAALRDLLDSFACDNLAALWDMFGPYFKNGEDPDTTIKNLGNYVKHVHIKDAIKTENGTEFCLIGEGEMPIGEMMGALRSVNYDGFISLEWDPLWCEELDDMEIIFSQFTPNQHRNWTDEQVLRFYSLQLQAIEKLNAAGGAYQDPISLLKDALANTRRTEVKTVLTVHLAHRLSLAKRHEEALDLLLQLAESTSNKETRARAYLLAARQAEQLKSLEQLTLAVELFAAAAEHNTRYRNHALMLQARVLAWINRGAEARRILSELLRRNDLSSSEQALALSIQAHEQTLRGTPEGLSEALLTNNRIFEVQNLSQAWITRARIQRASILARNGLTDEAIAQYMQLIESVSAATEAEMNDEKWFVLYFAGAGAVSQYLSQSKHAEAAELADMIAAWPLKPDAHRPVIGPGHRAQQFADWADNIRKFNFQSRALQPES